MRAIYIASSPLSKLGKKHPQSPPLHLHFDQSESFLIAQGKIGTTESWSATDHIWTKESGVREITPWLPHTFFPVADSTEDAIFYIWAHPESVDDPMDWLFFRNILMLVDDMMSGKRKMNPLQLFLMQ